MTTVRTKEITVGAEKGIDKLTNDWLIQNQDNIQDIVDIKYHTQMTDEIQETSVLIIYIHKTS